MSEVKITLDNGTKPRLPDGWERKLVAIDRDILATEVTVDGLRVCQIRSGEFRFVINISDEVQDKVKQVLGEFVILQREYNADQAARLSARILAS
jgi:hypothetical protein